ncbi:hypothetical protein D3C78_1289310 [compost metagenome]
METAGVVHAVDPGLPVATAVDRTQDQVESADDEAFALIGEPDIEERLVRALFRQALRLVLPAFDTGVVVEHQLADLPAIELLLPALSGIAAVQHHAIMADRPAFAGSGEKYGGKVGADRHFGLLPELAAVIGIQDVATLAHRHQTLASFGQVEQRTLRRQFAALRRQVQHIDEGRGLSQSRVQQQAQGRQGDPLVHSGNNLENGAAAP